MKNKTLARALQELQDTRRCSYCPVDPPTCRRVSNLTFSEERCLLVLALGEVLAFHTEESKKAFRTRRKKTKEGS